MFKVAGRFMELSAEQFKKALLPTLFKPGCMVTLAKPVQLVKPKLSMLVMLPGIVTPNRPVHPEKDELHTLVMLLPKMTVSLVALAKTEVQFLMLFVLIVTVKLVQPE